MTNRYFLRFRRFLRDQCGQDMVEYVLLAGFVAVSAGAAQRTADKLPVRDQGGY